MFKKVIAPIVVGILTVAALCLYFIFASSFIEALWLKIVIIAAMIALAAAMIFVTVQRVREIKKEDIDDVVSKY